MMSTVRRRFPKLQRFLAAAGDENGQTGHFQKFLREIAHQIHVVHHEHAALALRERGLARRGDGRDFFARERQVKMKRRALPKTLSTSMKPPASCATRCTIGRPRPVPLPASFVVKNGWKIRGSRFGAMPQPVSATLQRA
jgi:hypothetical protein